MERQKRKVNKGRKKIIKLPKRDEEIKSMSLSPDVVAYMQQAANQFNVTFKVTTEVPPTPATVETTLFAPNVPPVVIPVV